MDGQGVGLRRIDLERQGVVGHRCHVVGVQPRHGRERQAGVGTVLTGAEAVGHAAAGVVQRHPTRPDEHDVAGPYLHATHLRRSVQVGGGDGIRAVEQVDPPGPGHVQQHAPGADAAKVLDSTPGGTVLCCDGRGVVAVVHLPRVGDVAEAIPVGAGLQAQGHVVVTGVEGVRVVVGIHALVQSVQGHRRIVPTGDESDLDAVVLQRDGQRDGPTVADAVPGGQHHLGGDQVQGADLVVRTPAAPVADL